MKQIVFSLFFFVFFIGCGSSSVTDAIGVGEINSSIDELSTSVALDDIQRDIKEDQFIELSGFAKIQDLIKKSRDGVFNDVTYLCVGDSTRAFSDGVDGDYSQKMFERLKESLDEYNVSSILLARGSQELLHFLELKFEAGVVRTPTYKDVINATPGTGEHTIIDFSLGINDLWDLNIQTREDMVDAEAVIKDRVIQAIELILLDKPDVNIVLTSPNPLLDWEGGSNIYLNVYKEVSSELNLPLINYVDNIMPPRNPDINDTASEEFQAWYRHEDTGIDPIHFSEFGLYKVADYILEQILPKD